MGAIDRGDKELTDISNGASRAERIEAALQAGFEPVRLEVVDDSAKHAGHAGARPGGETHFTVRLASPRFRGVPRVGRQRMVNEALTKEFASGLHALAMELKSPEEI